MSGLEHETALVRAFIAPKRRDRYLGLLASARGREKLRRALAHCCRDLDYRFAHELPLGTHTPEQISALLHERGAPAECVLLSEDGALDGRRMPLIDALEAIVGRGHGHVRVLCPGTVSVLRRRGSSPALHPRASWLTIARTGNAALPIDRCARIMKSCFAAPLKALAIIATVILGPH